jgi:DNA-binding Xre family transcriptional regulator
LKALENITVFSEMKINKFKRQGHKRDIKRVVFERICQKMEFRKFGELTRNNLNK